MKFFSSCHKKLIMQNYVQIKIIFRREREQKFSILLNARRCGSEEEEEGRATLKANSYLFSSRSSRFAGKAIVSEMAKMIFESIPTVHS
jgi:cation transport regulator ChaC